MESNPITPRPLEPAVARVRESDEREPGRRQFDEERRKAFRRSRDGQDGETPDAELRLSPEARRVVAEADERTPRESGAEDSALEVRGRRLDIRI